MDKADIIAYIIIPSLIFFARIIDVSIGTLRIILVSRGNRLVAPVLGFMEVIIWLVALSQIMKNLNNVVSYIAYGSGFACGNFVGIWIEGKLALGLQAVRIISTNELQSLPMILRDEGYAVTTVNATGARGPVLIIYTVVSRKNVKHVLSITKMFEPRAFVTVEDIKGTHAGYFKPKLPYRHHKMK